MSASREHKEIEYSNEDTSYDLMTFCMNLVHHSQWNLQRRFRCGSRVEVRSLPSIAQQFEINARLMDSDEMRYFITGCAVSSSTRVPESYNGLIARYYTEDVHIGYVRLIPDIGIRTRFILYSGYWPEDYGVRTTTSSYTHTN